MTLKHVVVLFCLRTLPHRQMLHLLYDVTWLLAIPFQCIYCTMSAFKHGFSNMANARACRHTCSTIHHILPASSTILTMLILHMLSQQVVGGKMTESGRLCAYITKVRKGSLADTVGHLRPGTSIMLFPHSPLI